MSQQTALAVWRVFTGSMAWGRVHHLAIARTAEQAIDLVRPLVPAPKRGELRFHAERACEAAEGSCEPEGFEG